MNAMTYSQFADAPAAAIDAGQPAAATLRQRRVLHIDGDDDSALLLATLLVPEAQVTRVPTLAAATRAIRLGGYSLVVLDPDLPDGDGAPLLEMLECADAPPPVLLYSARDSIWSGAADAALLKPATSMRQLARTLARLLDGAPGANSIHAGQVLI